MIRKYFMLGSVLLLFLYTSWNFYSEALSYDPLSELSVKQQKTKETDEIVVAYSPAWSKDITDKNLFTPDRSGPKPPPPPPPPPTPPPPPPPRKPELSLRGISQNAAGEYVGYMEIDKATAVPMRKGDKLDDIEVLDVSERKVVLQWLDEKITFSIEHIKTIDTPTAPLIPGSRRRQ